MRPLLTSGGLDPVSSGADAFTPTGGSPIRYPSPRRMQMGDFNHSTRRLSEVLLSFLVGGYFAFMALASAWLAINLEILPGDHCAWVASPGGRCGIGVLTWGFTGLTFMGAVVTWLVITKSRYSRMENLAGVLGFSLALGVFVYMLQIGIFYSHMSVHEGDNWLALLLGPLVILGGIDAAHDKSKKCKSGY